MPVSPIEAGRSVWISLSLPFCLTFKGEESSKDERPYNQDDLVYPESLSLLHEVSMIIIMSDHRMRPRKRALSLWSSKALLTSSTERKSFIGAVDIKRCDGTLKAQWKTWLKKFQVLSCQFAATETRFQEQTIRLFSQVILELDGIQWIGFYAI